MFVLIESRTSLKMGHVRSKTRLLGQILQKPCVCYRGHIFSPIIMKLGQNVCLDAILDELKNGQILEKHCSLMLYLTIRKALVSDSRAIMALLLYVCSRSLLKTLWEMEKLLIMSNFSFCHSVFYPYGKLSTIFIKFEIVCKAFQFGRV